MYISFGDTFINAKCVKTLKEGKENSLEANYVKNS